MTAMSTHHEPAARPLPRLVDEPGVQLGLAHVGLVCITLAADAVRAPQLLALALLAVTASVGSRHVPTNGALCLGLSAWAFWNGFVENRWGQLTLAPHDLALLVVPVAMAWGGMLSARRLR
jgi:hypothetical protein